MQPQNATPTAALAALASSARWWLYLLWVAVGFAAPAATGPPLSEPLGPCSRRTPLVISEVMRQPAARIDGRNVEFVELYNSQPWFADLSGFRLAGDIQFVFPEGTRLAANAFLVVARVPADLQTVHALDNVVGPYSGGLAGVSWKIRLEHRSGAVLLDLNLGSAPRWPLAAAGAGHSLVLARPTLGERDPHAWSASARIGGSPGGPEPAADDPLHALVINEVSARPDLGQTRFVELHNHGAAELDLSGCSLSGDPAEPGFPVPAGLRIAAGGFAAFEEGQFGFDLSPTGGVIFLAAPQRAAILDAVRYGAQATGRPEGRSPNGGPAWRPLVHPTSGVANAGFLVPDLVINELMYHPISEAQKDEYVELFNAGAETLDLSGWRFVDGIDFTIPSGTSLPAGGYLVVARDAAHLRARYPQLSSGNTVGDFTGALSNAGERVALARPETVLVPDGQGGRRSVVAEVIVDEVTYATGGRWGQWADGGGSSLELVHARSDHRAATSWADSNEDGKAEWTTVEFTGRVDNYMSTSVSYSSNPLQVLLLGAGECLLDDVTASLVDRANLVVNPGFEAGLSSWIAQGNHEHARLELVAADGRSALRLRSTGRGDPAANHLLGRRSGAFPKGAMATLRARARWLHGSPEIILRLPGNTLEAYGRLTVPTNLGTPGLPNSRAAAAVGPAILAVHHSPTLPAVDQPVVVTALVQAVGGRPDVTLRHRLDPSADLTSLTMHDDGVDDDAVADDGLFTATIPGQSRPQLIAFHIVATTVEASGVTSGFPDDAPAGECLVRVGERVPAGNFGVYRLWMTDASRRRWASRPPLSNEPLRATFVNGEHRVIHGAGAMYSGSGYWAPSWTGPTGGPCDYSLTFPGDDRFLGSTATTVSWPGLSGYPDPVAQTEQFAYWTAEQLGLPFNYRRYVVVYFNGGLRNAVMEDTQQPDRDLVEQWFPHDAAGELYKMQGFYDLDARRLAWSSLEDFAIADSRQKLARYRWNWGKRSARGTMNDYRSFFELIRTANLAEDEGYDEQVAHLIDLDQWARTLAVERICGNWDSFGYANGQNMYFYKPTAGPWQLLIWDVDFQLGGPVADPPTRDLFTHGNLIYPDWTADPTTRRLFKHPPFRRAYLRALASAANGPLARAAELIDAKATAFAADGVGLASPASLKSYLNARRNYIFGRLEPFRAPFSILSPTGDGLRSDQPLVALQGTASFEVESLRINGLAYPAEWATPTNWSMVVPLRGARTEFLITGHDAAGQPIAGAAQSLTVNYTGGEPLPTDRIVINEWMASNGTTLTDPADGDFEDWFELYNPNPFPVDLSGYGLTDAPLISTRSICPPGMVIGPRGFMLVWADEEPAQNLGSRDLHVGFKLPRAGGTIALFDRSGRAVDQIAFGAQDRDVSQGRWPDGEPATVRRMPVTTPRSQNAVPEATSTIRMSPSMVLGPGAVMLTWTAEPGKSYRVQSSPRIDAASWTELLELTAVDQTASATVPMRAAGQQFYRIVGLR